MSDSVKKRQSRHAKKRALERFGIEISTKEIVRLIQQGKSTPVSRRSTYRCVHIVKVKDIHLPVVYNSHTKTIVTVLPNWNFK